MVQRETLDRIWHEKGRIDIVKLDIEGHETKFPEGGRKTISAHRAVLLIELNRVHQEMRRVTLTPRSYQYYQNIILSPNCGAAVSCKSTILRNAATRTFWPSPKSGDMSFACIEDDSSDLGGSCSQTVPLRCIVFWCVRPS
jgi:hypothetical protein